MTITMMRASWQLHALRAFATQQHFLGRRRDATRRRCCCEAFNAGAKDARECGLYLLELLLSRDLVQFVYEGQGRAAEGEAMTEAAAGRMGKPVSDFEELLAKRRAW